VEYYSCPDNVGRMGDMQTFELSEVQLSGLSDEACVVHKAG
jgi:hypothetical protein